MPSVTRPTNSEPLGPSEKIIIISCSLWSGGPVGAHAGNGMASGDRPRRWETSLAKPGPPRGGLVLFGVGAPASGVTVSDLALAEAGKGKNISARKRGAIPR